MSKPMSRRILFLSLLGVMLLSACVVLIVFAVNQLTLSQTTHTHIEAIKEKNILVVRVINSPFELVDSEYAKGFNVELVNAFAKDIGVALDIQHLASIDDIDNNPDIIIGPSVAPNKDWVQGPALYTHNLQLVSLEAHASSQTSQDYPRLSFNETIRYRTSVQSLLRQDKENNQYILETSNLNEQFHFSSILEYPANNSFVPLVGMVNKQSDYALVDSITAALFRRIEPRLTIVANVSENEEFAWFFNATSTDVSLIDAFKSFHSAIETESLLTQLAEKYFNIISSFDKSQTHYFIQAVENKLPKFEPLFKQYAEEFDWRLIAAIAYQESHWDPNAKSPTGVRGMMMLTRDTAKYLGIDDRLDTEKSIMGGIEYLRFLLKRVPESVDESDRIWFALAAYNMGIGHLWDARELTALNGENPDKWHDLKNYLPKLRDENIYPHLKYGFARGDEALRYVENIRRFYTTLLGLESIENIQVQEIERS